MLLESTAQRINRHGSDFVTLRKSISRAKNEKAVDDLAVRIKRSKTQNSKLCNQSVLIIAVEKNKKFYFRILMMQQR